MPESVSALEAMEASSEPGRVSETGVPVRTLVLETPSSALEGGAPE